MSLRIAQLIPDNRVVFREPHTPVPWFGMAAEALLAGFEEVPEVEVHVLSCEKVNLPSPTYLSPRIRFHTVTVRRWGWLASGYLGCVRAVRAKLREIRPDIVHGQGTERDAAWCAAWSGFPNVVTVHGIMSQVVKTLKSRPHRAAARLEGMALRRTHGTFCNSAYTERLIAPRTPKTWRAPNALRNAFFDTTAAGMPSADAVVLLCVGIVSPYKRQLEVLQLAEELHRRGLKTRVDFIGTANPAAPYGGEFLARLKPAQAAGYARHLGRLEMPELIGALDKAQGLIHVPSEESFGLVVAEALARNRKLFAARVGGIADIADGVELAETFAPDDWLGFAEAIEAWVKRGAPVPTEAQATMRNRYHPHIVARRHVEIYREVLASASSTRRR